MPMTPFVRYIDYLLQTTGKNYEESGPHNVNIRAFKPVILI